jgi:hypothetical protein
VLLALAEGRPADAAAAPADPEAAAAYSLWNLARRPFDLALLGPQSSPPSRDRRSSDHTGMPEGQARRGASRLTFTVTADHGPRYRRPRGWQDRSTPTDCPAARYCVGKRCHRGTTAPAPAEARSIADGLSRPLSRWMELVGGGAVSAQARAHAHTKAYTKAYTQAYTFTCTGGR